MTFDLSTFEEPDPSLKIEDIVVGGLYEVKATREGVNGPVDIVRVYYIKDRLNDGSFKVIVKNNASEWSDQFAILYKTSTRKIKPDLDMLSLDSKEIRELGKKEAKEYVSGNIKSWEVRKLHGLKPIKYLTPLGHTIEITNT